MGNPLTEGKYRAEFLLSEADGEISRDNVTVTVPALTKLIPGQVLGVISADGKRVPVDSTASDGRETAYSVLYGELDNTAGVAPADFAAVEINFSAEVGSADLVWGSSDSAAGIVQLRARGVKPRS